MVLCFLCNTSFINIDGLINQKLHHLLKNNQKLICIENNCLSSFCTFSSFKKHYSIHKNNTVLTQSNIEENEIHSPVLTENKIIYKDNTIININKITNTIQNI